jgi:hypothetical protein
MSNNRPPDGRDVAVQRPHFRLQGLGALPLPSTPERQTSSGIWSLPLFFSSPLLIESSSVWAGLGMEDERKQMISVELGKVKCSGYLV